MKLKDITQWPERWSAPFGTMEAHAPVATCACRSVSMGTSIIALAVQCSDGRFRLA